MIAIPDYKEIMELVKKGLTLEAQEKIMELRIAALGLQEENLKLRERVKELETERSIEFDAKEGLYFLCKPEGGKEGPFCPVCRDKEKKIVRLHDGRCRYAATQWICLICGNTFGQSFASPTRSGFGF